jgi:hypothetical protein
MSEIATRLGPSGGVPSDKEAIKGVRIGAPSRAFRISDTRLSGFIYCAFDLPLSPTTLSENYDDAGRAAVELYDAF